MPRAETETMQAAVSPSSDGHGAVLLMRFRPAWAYIDGVRECGRFFCKATFGSEEAAERARVIIQETLEDALRYSSDGPQSELELTIEANGGQLELSLSSLPEPTHADRLERELSELRALDAREAYLAAFRRAANEPDAAASLGLARVRYEGNVELSIKREEGGRIRLTAVGKL